MKVEPSFNLEVAPLLFGLASGNEKPRCRGSRAIRGHWQRAGDGDEMEQPRSSGADSGDVAALPSALGLSLGWTVTFSGVGGRGRSEEHTSELQSLMRISYAVFCMKKKKHKIKRSK